MSNLNFLRPAAILLIAFVIMFGGCAPKTAIKPSSQHSSFLEPVSGENILSFCDDLDQASLKLAIERNLLYLNKFRETGVVYFGKQASTVKEMKETLLVFRDIMQGQDSDDVKERKIRDTFNFYQSTGNDGKGTVLFTGYYAPVLEGSFTKTERFRYPIYRPPEEVSKGGMIPYYKRAEIDGKGVLVGRNLELLWVDDPVALFFLHVQGSGQIKLPNSSFVQVGYAQSNGQPYRSIANYLLAKGKIKKKEQSLQTIKKYLREHPEDMADVLSYNERYVFFRIVENGPYGALNIPVTAGRTIAADHDLFPKGALALIRTRKPVINKGEIVSWQPFSRFVLNQDAGAAIKGPGRIDLFCGSGEEAAATSGSLKEVGELLFLLKK